MKPQYEITEAGPVLDANGSLAQRGYSKRSVLTYRRKDIKAPPYRIKEWDFYQVSDDECCLQLTIGHTSYAGMLSMTVFTFADGARWDAEAVIALPFGRLRMPESTTSGDLCHNRGGIDIGFEVFGGGRRLRCRAGARKNTPAMEAEVHLVQSSDTSIVIATPFDEYAHAFYYNEKINCMPASGYVKVGEKRFEFEADSAFGLLDWGRGVWPFSTEWYWGNGSTLVDGKRFGFNIGHGFGNTSAATENMLFYDGMAHKLSEVHFDLGAGGYMSPKHFGSDDGRFEMDFVPIYDRYTETKLLFVDNHCHQIFGKFSGKVVLDDGRAIEVKDMMAFTEHAVNHW